MGQELLHHHTQTRVFATLVLSSLNFFFPHKFPAVSPVFDLFSFWPAFNPTNKNRHIKVSNCLSCLCFLSAWAVWDLTNGGLFNRHETMKPPKELRGISRSSLPHSQRSSASPGYESPTSTNIGASAAGWVNKNQWDIRWLHAALADAAGRSGRVYLKSNPLPPIK